MTRWHFHCCTLGRVLSRLRETGYVVFHWLQGLSVPGLMSEALLCWGFHQSCPGKQRCPPWGSGQHVKGRGTMLISAPSCQACMTMRQAFQVAASSEIQLWCLLGFVEIIDITFSSTEAKPNKTKQKSFHSTIPFHKCKQNKTKTTSCLSSQSGLL